jgi:hypothetical protein
MAINGNKERNRNVGDVIILVSIKLGLLKFLSLK